MKFTKPVGEIKDVVIYARYSSKKQDECSIEGQLKSCRDYIDKNRWHEAEPPYIDREKTGTNDKRPEFQRMIADAKKKGFQAIIVYKFDRFARSRKHSINYKELLQKYGIKVLSACEAVSDDENGELVEGFHELLAEWYSKSLSKIIKRGMDLNADKFLSTGGNIALGFKTCKETKQFLVDEEKAPFVKVIFEMYASGKTMAEISRYMNSKGIRTRSNVPFNKNSLQSLLQNKRYIGIYTYKGTERRSDNFPRIISDDLFFRVQERMEQNKKAQSRSRAKEEYLLTTKLHCGHCGALMVGRGGTSRNGSKHYYYSCNGAKLKICDKKWVIKKHIEGVIFTIARNFLSDDKNIELVANSIATAYEREQDLAKLNILQKQLGENQSAMRNLLKVIEKGGDFADHISDRMNELKQEQNQLKQEIAIEEKAQALSEAMTAPQIRFFLMTLRSGGYESERSRKGIIKILVNRIDLNDNKRGRLFMNAGESPVEITDEMMSNIENAPDLEAFTACGSHKRALVVTGGIEPPTSGL